MAVTKLNGPGIPSIIANQFRTGIWTSKELTAQMKKPPRSLQKSYRSNFQLELLKCLIQPPRCDDEIGHYLPHHMVKREEKRGRIVYDALAKCSGYRSLNECLYGGASMIEDLTALLLKFRLDQISMVADVEKAFLQIGLQEEDRDVTRFLWVKDFSNELTEDNIIQKGWMKNYQ
ncbi:uncharacterized protein LOC113231484 [Hyposmocoma kahamanoa]|uniref:uncharacterized protein LOC113231484 n=1 Tax=Hyposmocoma kahamanoa TaxID=1477025 RepID=UPI000E6D7442|nr:uncharacterized protein LOC113231484 [Hyposmocoma kahamanoa]